MASSQRRLWRATTGRRKRASVWLWRCALRGGSRRPVDSGLADLGGEDQTLSLRQRAEIANRLKPAVFVSIHVNASSNPAAKGVETYYLSNTHSDRRARLLAERENADLIQAEEAPTGVLETILKGRAADTGRMIGESARSRAAGAKWNGRRRWRGRIDPFVEAPFAVLVRSVRGSRARGGSLFIERRRGAPKLRGSRRIKTCSLEGSLRRSGRSSRSSSRVLGLRLAADEEELGGRSSADVVQRRSALRAQVAQPQRAPGGAEVAAQVLIVVGHDEQRLVEVCQMVFDRFRSAARRTSRLARCRSAARLGDAEATSYHHPLALCFEVIDQVTMRGGDERVTAHEQDARVLEGTGHLLVEAIGQSLTGAPTRALSLSLDGIGAVQRSTYRRHAPGSAGRSPKGSPA